LFDDGEHKHEKTSEPSFVQQQMRLAEITQGFQSLFGGLRDVDFLIQN